jgi:hypothetical protein
MNQTWKRITQLDDERRLIETRIHLRAKQHHGAALTHDEQVLLAGAPSVFDDAYRYVAIEDEQWSLMGVVVKDTRLSVPL